MGDPVNMLEGSSASMDDSCPWTEVCASNTQLASLNKQHLDFFPVFDRSMVSMGRKIGEGGQGCVYAAKFHLPYSFKPLPVVVKKFKPFVGVSQGHFPREMVSVRSYNLCVPYGVFFEGDSLCMIMRWFSCDLRAAIDSRRRALQDEVFGPHGPPFIEGVGRSIILQLAMGLKVLHECGVYHGDLKAANILLRTSDKKGITSFLAPPYLALADFERSEGVVGTAFFRAPEVLQSLITRVPLSKEQWLLADIYSFGMVCYEVLTGMIPFDGHRLSDYDLVLNGGRPELPDHVPQYWRDLILRCWHADPHSRPKWTDIIEVLEQHDVDHVIGDIRFYINNLVGVKSLSFESLMHKLKQSVEDLTTLHESDSKSFGSEFIPYYWASEFVATAEEYASKFEVDSFLESSQTCDVREFFERSKLCSLLKLQFWGASFGYLTFLDRILEEQLDVVASARQTIRERERLLGMIATIASRISQDMSKVECTKDFEIGTSWTQKLLFFHSLVMWFLWSEHAAARMEQEFMMKCLVPTHVSWTSVIQALLIFLCVIVNTYIYVLAMITSEPILLGLQYGLYKTKGCNNVLYRSSGERICRFQRMWMSYTRYKVLDLTEFCMNSYNHECKFEGGWTRLFHTGSVELRTQGPSVDLGSCHCITVTCRAEILDQPGVPTLIPSFELHTEYQAHETSIRLQFADFAYSAPTNNLSDV